MSIQSELTPAKAALEVAEKAFQEIAKEKGLCNEMEMRNDGARVWFVAKGKRSLYIHRESFVGRTTEHIYQLISETIEGMSLESFTRLPSLLQPGESCRLLFGHGMASDFGRVLKVHFTKDKVQYDVEVQLRPHNEPEAGFYFVRLYNVDDIFVLRPVSND